jgi:hypothetical protein
MLSNFDTLQDLSDVAVLVSALSLGCPQQHGLVPYDTITGMECQDCKQSNFLDTAPAHEAKARFLNCWNIVVAHKRVDHLTGMVRKDIREDREKRRHEVKHEARPQRTAE